MQHLYGQQSAPLQDTATLAPLTLAIESLKLASITPAAVAAFGTKLCGSLASLLNFDGAYYVVLATLAGAVYTNYSAIWMSAALLVVYGAPARCHVLVCVCSANGDARLLMAGRGGCTAALTLGNGCDVPSWITHMRCICMPQRAQIAQSLMHTEGARTGVTSEMRGMHAGMQLVQNARGSKYMASPAAMGLAAAYALVRYFKDGCANCASELAACFIIARLGWSVFEVVKRIFEKESD